MNDFFQYVAAMWQLFIEDLGRFFQLAIVDPWSEVGQNFKDYNDVLNLYKPGFGAGGWALFVVYYIIIAALIGGIIFVIFLITQFAIPFILGIFALIFELFSSFF